MCRHIRYLLCYLKVPFGEWGEYIYIKKKQRGVPPRVPLPPGILVPRLHGLPVLRVRPCPTAEFPYTERETQHQQQNESDTTRVGIRYAHSEQRVCVEMGCLSLMYPITVRSNGSGYLYMTFVCIVMYK